jgi:hypothetical protein
MTMRLAAMAFALAGTLTVGSLDAAEFKSDAKTNADIAKRVRIPVYFTVPDTARLGLPASINATDKLIDFHHPDAKGANYGLRIVVTQRGGFGQRMAKSGLIQTGDILLSFRPEWAGGGAYPNIQMGVSHAGTAFTRNGEIRHVDNPLNSEFNGSGLKGSFDSSDYRELKFIHVIRPRDLTKAQRANIDQWAARFLDNAGKIYPQEIEFNSDYNAPKYPSDKSLTFVKRMGAAGLLQHPPKQALFCSEFAWSLLALRNCDPASAADAFKASRVPSCISPVMTPLSATGDYPRRQSRNDTIGLADGPLAVIKGLKLSKVETEQLVAQVFTEDPEVLKKMSSGHQQLAKALSPEFGKLRSYYDAVASGGITGTVVGSIKETLINLSVPDNYSPTSYLINTMLPDRDRHRQMDYVATIMFE